jgi:CRP/FNR family cyclic AMP-dependent transcriptional regulator
MLDPKIELLRHLPILKGLASEQLASILNIATKAFFEPGDNLITKDQAGETAFLIMTGAAQCLHFPGTPESSGSVGPGMLVGELAILVETIHSLTVQAKERVRAMGIHRAALWRVMEHDPAIAEVISDNLLLRLQTLASELRRVDILLAKAERGALPAMEIKLPPLQGAPSSVTPRGLHRASSQ